MNSVTTHKLHNLDQRSKDALKFLEHKLQYIPKDQPQAFGLAKLGRVVTYLAAVLQEERYESWSNAEHHAFAQEITEWINERFQFDHPNAYARIQYFTANKKDRELGLRTGYEGVSGITVEREVESLIDIEI